MGAFIILMVVLIGIMVLTRVREKQTIDPALPGTEEDHDAD